MVTAHRWLIDKSAFVRLDRSSGVELWLERIARGLVSVATVTLLELGFSARNASDWQTGFSEPPITRLIREPITPAMEKRMIEVQGLLANRGYHRAVGVADLMVAATAELAGLTILHLDKDFELIAEVTRQPVERLDGDFGACSQRSQRVQQREPRRAAAESR